LGWLAVAWIEHFCVHGPGDVEGRPVVLDDEFAGYLVDAYALRLDGRKLYDAAVISRAKGRAKSELASEIVEFEAFGPCRYGGTAEGGEVFRWRDFAYTFERGEPMGRPVTHPFIRCLATEEGQAGNTYDNVYFNLTQGPLSEGMPKGSAGLTRTFLPFGGEIRPSTASSSSKDGGKETFTVFDETHLYATPELRRMYATVDRNCRKRKAAEPWVLQTTTMYQPGTDSVAETTHGRAKLIAEGHSRASRLLFDHREAPADVDLTDMDAMTAALREVYGPFAEVLDLEGIVENEFWNVEKDIEDSRRYFFNQPTSARDAWTTWPDWSANAAPASLVVADSDPIALFFDGSKTSDSTALVGCRISDGYTFVIEAWERPPSPAGDGWEVDRVDVDRTVRGVHAVRDVVAFFGDVREFESYVDDWGAAFGEKYVISASPGRQRHAVAWDMRSRTAEFTKAVERALVDITERTFLHDGDSRLARHALNARRAPNKYGVSISKESRQSPKKIDILVAAIGARMVRRLVLASDGWANRSKQTGKRQGRVVGW
jgi:hypothetical protein